jgi:hypothetical protein
MLKRQDLSSARDTVGTVSRDSGQADPILTKSLVSTLAISPPPVAKFIPQQELCPFCSYFQAETAKPGQWSLLYLYHVRLTRSFSQLMTCDTNVSLSQIHIWATIPVRSSPSRMRYLD